MPYCRKNPSFPFSANHRYKEGALNFLPQPSPHMLIRLLCHSLLLSHTQTRTHTYANSLFPSICLLSFFLPIFDSKKSQAIISNPYLPSLKRESRKVKIDAEHFLWLQFFSILKQNTFEWTSQMKEAAARSYVRKIWSQFGLILGKKKAAS